MMSHQRVEHSSDALFKQPVVSGKELRPMELHISIMNRVLIQLVAIQNCVQLLQVLLRHNH